MQQTRGEAESYFSYRVLTSLLLFGLLAEWLIPWLHAGEWTELLQPQTLILLVGVILTVGLFRVRLLTHIIVATLFCILALMWLFKGDGQSSGEWLLQLLPSLGNDLTQILKYGVVYMSDEIRILLLFLGWVLLAPALQSLIWYHQIAFSLLAITTMYQLILYTTLGVDIFYALLRVVAEGLLLMALTTMPRIRRKLLISHAWPGFIAHQWVGTLLLTLVMIGGSFLISDQRERQLEPIAWASVFSNSLVEEMSALSGQITGVPLKNTDSRAYSSQNLGVSGYSHHDELLGQTLTSSKTPVFRGWSSMKSYWRAEAKTEYNGHGWVDEAQTLSLQSIPMQSDEALQSWKSRQDWVGARIRQDIEYVNPLNGMPIMQSGLNGVVLDLNAVNPDRDLQNYIVGVETGAIYAPTSDSVIKSYSVITELPITDEFVLREIEPLENDTSEKLWQAESLERDLQLPSELPPRVAALASEVSGAGLTSRYDQVKAIEQYLKNNYTYSLNSTIPASNEDFVDQFLFEQKEGYCVHFSTAMVILLRTQGIPARWVKGYQMGEAIDERTSEAGVVETLYEVRESDAHAWVEVYFPTIGWVPFDPTPTSAENDQVGALSSFHQQWNRLMTDSSSVINSLSSTQWLIGLGGLLAMVGSILTFILVRKHYRLRSILRKYRKAYREQQISSQIVSKAHSAEGELPARDRARLTKLQRAKAKLQINHNKLEQQMLIAAQYVISRLERIHCLEEEYNHPLTWRARINAVEKKIDNTYQCQLQQLLNWLEQSSYNDPALRCYPDARLFYKVLNLLFGASTIRNAKRNNSNVKQDEIVREAFPAS